VAKIFWISRETVMTWRTCGGSKDFLARRPSVKVPSFGEEPKESGEGEPRE
jgi:hypothetical protein